VRAGHPVDPNDPNVVDAAKALFQIDVVVFIVSMMLVAGVRTTRSVLGFVLRNVGLVVLVLVVNLALVPLIGWGVAALFSLSASGYIALVLIASSPEVPFGTRLAMMQKVDVVAGSSLPVLLAAIGSITFPITATQWMEKLVHRRPGRRRS
jgi:BASS family bile acid:Na+ symporter